LGPARGIHLTFLTAFPNDMLAAVFGGRQAIEARPAA